jgi:hypothetical protein
VVLYIFFCFLIYLNFFLALKKKKKKSIFLCGIYSNQNDSMFRTEFNAGEVQDWIAYDAGECTISLSRNTNLKLLPSLLLEFFFGQIFFF